MRYLEKLNKAKNIVKNDHIYVKKIKKRIKYLINELDNKNKKTTIKNICLQSLFSVGGTISDFDCIVYLQRKI